MKQLPLLLFLALVIGCAGPATGPVKGVLVVYENGMNLDEVSAFLSSVQLHVTTVETEDVFDYSMCSREEFQDDLRTRRTILFLTDDADKLPEELVETDGIYAGGNIWAEDQIVLGLVLTEGVIAEEVSRQLLQAYNRHLTDYIYGSFVSTQMSSPERIDSLLTLGFSIDIPKSYHLEEWDENGGFIQYQRNPSDECLLMLSVRWIEDDLVLSQDEAVLWRETVARNRFYDASADSVDRSSVQVFPLELRDLRGWKLLGMWRNPEHLNAGAFTSYVFRSGGRRYLIDMEVFHEHREKEPYIREGWIIMNTFIPGEEDG